jgi:hypothetical protein
MAISELFSISFLFSISIIVVLFGLLYAYVSYRFGEQDHKLNSMVGLVSTMAEESQFFRSRLHLLQQQISVPSKDNIEYSSQMMGAGNLIPVSDDEASEESDNDDESNATDDGVLEDNTISDDESDDNESDDNESDDNESDVNESDVDDSGEQDIHKINLLDEDIETNDIIEDLNHSEIKTIHLEQPIDINIESIDNIEIKEASTEINVSEDNVLFLKNISMSDLGELTDSHKPDYKKMSLNKLRELVINKGLVEDASKLKKNEILKMLGDE